LENNETAEESQYIPDDYFQVKIIDRQLSAPHVKPDILFCDVGGSSGTDDFPYVKLGAKCVCLDLHLNLLGARFGIDSIKKASV
jgi:hypothetical protein